MKGLLNANELKKEWPLMERERFSQSMSGHDFFWLCGLNVEIVLTLYSPFCHEDAARYTNLHKMTNNVETMNIKAYKTASGCVAYGTNSDT